MKRQSPTLSLPAIAACAALLTAPAYASSASPVSPVAFDGSALVLPAPSVEYELGPGATSTLVPTVEAVRYCPGAGAEVRAAGCVPPA